MGDEEGVVQRAECAKSHRAGTREEEAEGYGVLQDPGVVVRRKARVGVVNTGSGASWA